jgi:protein-S-isoprenylcysteine O-methyltransferase Ste14
VSWLDFFARWRVRIGYILAIVVLWLARPTPVSILAGAAVGLLGLLIRAYAAGYLHKQEVLTVTGPYSYTRNPLYFGSSILAAGAAIAMHSVYAFVMRREEMELHGKHGAEFDQYAATVPLFFPQVSASRQPDSPQTAFSWAQYKKNHEYQAAAGFLLLLVALVVIWWLRGA